MSILAKVAGLFGKAGGDAVGGVIEKVGEAIKSFVTTDAERQALMNELRQIEIEAAKEANRNSEALASLAIQEYQAEVSDRDSARNREVQALQAGSKNYLMNGIGGVHSGVWLYLLGYVIHSIVEKAISTEQVNNLLMLLGMLTPTQMLILSYYFGGSVGGRKALDTLSKKS